MAQFFLHWSGKIPHNSEFYRTLQQDAAGYINRANAISKRNGQIAQQKNYETRRDAINKQYIEPAVFLNGVVDNYARANGLIGTGPNETIANLTTPGVSELYDRLANADGGTVLYSTVDGKQVTVDWVRKQLHKSDPSLQFGITADDLNRINLRGVKGGTLGYRLAKKNHDNTSASYFTGQKADLGERARQDGTMSTDAAYWHVRHFFEDVTSDPNATLEEKSSAFRQWQTDMHMLAADPSVDDNTRTRILAEANGDTSQTSIAEDAFGLRGPGGTTVPGTGGLNDIGATWAGINFAQEQQALDTAKAGVWTAGTIGPRQDGTIGFTPGAGGKDIGVTDDPAYIQSLATGNTQLLHIPGGWGTAGVKDVYVAGVPVVLDKVTPVTTGSAAPSVKVATAYVTYQNGQQIVTYQYQAANGNTYFTTDPPWSSALKTTVTPTGVTIDGSPLNLTGADALSAIAAHPDLYKLTITGEGIVDPKNLSVGPNGTLLLHKTNASGQPTVSTIDPTQLISAVTGSPEQLLLSTNPTRGLAPDPTQDFHTLTQANLTATVGGQAEWDKLIQNPTFQQSLLTDLGLNSTLPNGAPDPAMFRAGQIQSTQTSGALLDAGTSAITPMTEWSYLNGPAAGLPTPRVGYPGQPGFGGTPDYPVSGGGNIGTPAPSAPPVPSLGNLGGFMGTYNALSRLGLMPPPPASAQPVRTTPSINTGINLTLPGVPPPPPPTTALPPITPIQPIKPPSAGGGTGHYDPFGHYVGPL